MATEEAEAADEPMATEEAEAADEPLATEEAEAADETVATEEAETADEPVATEEAEAADETMATEEAEAADDSDDADEADDTEMAAESDATTEPAADANIQSDLTLAGGSRELGRIFGTALTVLPTVQDADSAHEALPVLQSAADSLSTFVVDYKTAPASMKDAFKTVLQKYRFRLQATADTVLTREGVSPVIGDTVRSLMESVGEISH
ncbi:MAG: hypothetical protein HKN42_00575 [Granulosicoccus sp.]|nr:hypothetical protein [Granulosicoccus sp.]